MTQATLTDMKEVLKEHLEKNGTLNEIRSKMRAEIFNTLNNQPKNTNQLSEQNLIINELIREYLVYNNYNYTNSVLIPEASQPAEPLDRNFIANRLNIKQDTQTQQLPLLYSIVYGLKTLVEPDDYGMENQGSGPGTASGQGQTLYREIFDVPQQDAIHFQK